MFFDFTTVLGLEIDEDERNRFSIWLEVVTYGTADIYESIPCC